MTKQIITSIILFLAVFLATQTANATNHKFIQVGNYSSPPIGHVKFCQKNPQECLQKTKNPKVMYLSRKRWQQLIQINDRINETITPVSDLDNYREKELWTYPKNKGDCEDFALLKRKTLINLGWPSESLLMTVVYDPKTGGHAVLTVKTNYGEFILDNQISAVLPWIESPYRFLKRQSENNAALWKELNDNRFHQIAQIAQ